MRPPAAGSRRWRPLAVGSGTAPGRLRFAAAGLMFGLGLALADPWGLSPDAARGRDARAPAPDWTQGTGRGREGPAAPTDPSWAPASTGPDAGTPAPAAHPVWGGRPPAVPAGSAAWPAEPPPDYRFRPDGPATEAPPGRLGRSMDEGAALPGGDQRFRDDGAPPGGQMPSWSDLGGYRFRPLTDRERQRRGRDAPAAAPDPRPGLQYGPGPTWGPPGGWDQPVRSGVAPTP